MNGFQMRSGLVKYFASAIFLAACNSEAVVTPVPPPPPPYPNVWEVQGDTLAINRSVDHAPDTIEIEYTTDAPEDRLARLLLPGVRMVVDARNHRWRLIDMQVRRDSMPGLVRIVLQYPWAKIVYLGNDGTR